MKDSWSSVALGGSENGAIGRQHLGRLHKALAQQDFEIAVHIDRRMLELGTLALRSRHYGGRIQIQQVVHKLIGVLLFDAVRSQQIVREITFVERHNHARTAANRRSQDVPIIRIG